MRKICLFATYNPDHRIPYYVQIYLKELGRYAGEVWLISTHEPDEAGRYFLAQNNIVNRVEGNEGYDFGLWYKALEKLDTAVYDTIFLVNDSCILFKPLKDFMDWSGKTKADVFGMTSSDAVHYHLQSYFLMLGKKAIPVMIEYFKEKGVQNKLQEVIEVYEVGLSEFLQQRGMALVSYLDNSGYSGEFSPYYYCVLYHLRQGIPLIKKKILFCNYRKDERLTLARMNFKINPEHYRQFIRSQKDVLITFDRMEQDKEPGWSKPEILYFHLIRVTIQFLNFFRGKIRTMPR